MAFFAKHGQEQKLGHARTYPDGHCRPDQVDPIDQRLDKPIT